MVPICMRQCLPSLAVDFSKCASQIMLLFLHLTNVSILINIPQQSDLDGRVLIQLFFKKKERQEVPVLLELLSKYLVIYLDMFLSVKDCCSLNASA